MDLHPILYCRAIVRICPFLLSRRGPSYSRLRPHLYKDVQKMSDRLRELATELGVSSRNLANVFLDNPVYSRKSICLAAYSE